MNGAAVRGAVRTLRRMSALITDPAPCPGVALSPAELRAAELDGELVRVGDAYLPIDAPVGAVDRARSLAAARRETRLFVQRRSAAWVFGWCGEPTRHSFAVSIGSRVPSGTRHRTGARELVIDDSELCHVGGVLVTTPTRTLIDLARAEESECTIADLARMISLSGVSLDAVRGALSEARRAPFAARARQRLSAVADAVHVIHRVDAPHGVQHAVEVSDIAHLKDELRDRQAVA